MLPECNCELRLCKYYRGSRILTLATCKNPETKNIFFSSDEKKEIYYCKAFPDGIPDEIISGENDHSTLMEGQRGEIVFEYGVNPHLVEPYRAKNMVNLKLHGHDNLCSTIRDIYVKTTDEDIKLWCRIAMRMSKNMFMALQEYKEMLVEMGIKVGHEGRGDWQIRTKSLYKEEEISYRERKII